MKLREPPSVTLGVWRIGLLMIVMGGLGIFLLLILNVLAYFYWARLDAVPGSPLWQYVWLPSYMSWVALASVGTGFLIKCHRFRKTVGHRNF